MSLLIHARIAGCLSTADYLPDFCHGVALPRGCSSCLFRGVLLF